MSDAEALGSELREARQGRDLTLDQVEQQIRIRAKFLEALEQGNYAALPSPVQARGFLRNYARFLGLDGDLMVSRYDAALQGGRRRGRRVEPGEAPLTPTSAPRRTQTVQIQSPPSAPYVPPPPPAVVEKPERRRSRSWSSACSGWRSLRLSCCLACRVFSPSWRRTQAAASSSARCRARHPQPHPLLTRPRRRPRPFAQHRCPFRMRSRLLLRPAASPCSCRLRNAPGYGSLSMGRSATSDRQRPILCSNTRETACKSGRRTPSACTRWSMGKTWASWVHAARSLTRLLRQAARYKPRQPHRPGPPRTRPIRQALQV